MLELITASVLNGNYSKTLLVTAENM